MTNSEQTTKSKTNPWIFMMFFSAFISKLNALYISCMYFRSKRILIKDNPWMFLACYKGNFFGAIPNFATEKEQKRNFLDFTDVTLVVVDIKSERFVKSTCLQQDLFDMTMVTIMFDTKTSESESFIDRSIEGIINIMMEFHHF